VSDPSPDSTRNPARPFIFLDRDGTLIVERNYLSDPAQVELLPQVPEGLRALREMGYGLVVVTNQAGVGRGYYTLDAMHACNQRMRNLLAEHGLTLDGIYFCPHAPDAGCDCRKPLPGMALAAARDHAIELARSIVIGDKACDIDLGKAIGARTMLVRTGYGACEEAAGTCSPDDVANDLMDAARIISTKIQHDH
jgi:histidinol-phosphate phosphatase family protein